MLAASLTHLLGLGTPTLECVCCAAELTAKPDMTQCCACKPRSRPGRGSLRPRAGVPAQSCLTTTSSTCQMTTVAPSSQVTMPQQPPTTSHWEATSDKQHRASSDQR